MTSTTYIWWVMFVLGFSALCASRLGLVSIVSGPSGITPLLLLVGVDQPFFAVSAFFAARIITNISTQQTYKIHMLTAQAE